MAKQNVSHGRIALKKYSFLYDIEYHAVYQVSHFWRSRVSQNVKDDVAPPKKWYADDAPWRRPRPPRPDAPYDGAFDCDETIEGLMESRWEVPHRPGAPPRTWATRLGFPVDVIDDIAVDYMSDP